MRIYLKYQLLATKLCLACKSRNPSVFISVVYLYVHFPHPENEIFLKRQV